MSELSTLSRYRNFKDSIREVKWFKNGHKYSLMMKARSDTLKLNWRNHGFDENDKKCPLCKEQTETLQHFLLDCHQLQEARNKYLVLQKPRIEDEEKIMNKMLLLKEDDTDHEYYLNMIKHIWAVRTEKLKKEPDE